MKEIPPYQAIDIILQREGIDKLPEPVRGYAVTFPDSHLMAVLLTEEEATPEKLEELKSLSKWPDHIFYRPAWIHTAHTGFRKHWTPR